MIGSWAAGDECSVHRLVKRGEASPMLHGKPKKVEVGKPIRSWKIREDGSCSEGDVIIPELMARHRKKASEERSRSLRGARPAWIFTAAENTQKIILNQWTGGPTVTIESPAVKCPGSFRVRMGGIAERDQHIDIEKINHVCRGLMAR